MAVRSKLAPWCSLWQFPQTKTRDSSLGVFKIVLAICTLKTAEEESVTVAVFVREVSVSAAMLCGLKALLPILWQVKHRWLSSFTIDLVKAARSHSVGADSNALWQLPQFESSACCEVRLPGFINRCLPSPAIHNRIRPIVTDTTHLVAAPRFARQLRTGRHFGMVRQHLPSGSGPSLQGPPAS